MAAVLERLARKSDRIVVVGAGLAGTTAAFVLGKQGWPVTLVDARLSCPPVFKAEKIEPRQAELLRKFGLLEDLVANAGHIREVLSYFDGRLFQTILEEQYGMFYSEMVGGIRALLPGTVEFKLGRVVRIDNSDDVQRVTLDDGEELTTRLVVLACGLSGDLPASLRLKRTTVQKNQSVAIAFTIERADRQRFAFDSVTYYPARLDGGIDYATFFPIGQAMRVNLFAFPGAEDAWTRRFLEDPVEELRRHFPKLEEAIGAYRMVGKVETSLIHLYRTEGEVRPGIVLIGDAAQNVCPSTGMGLSKVFTDVDVLCTECVPEWFASPGMSSDKTASFWKNPRKHATDAKAIQDAIYRRKARTESSLRWKIHRARLEFAMRFGWKRKLAASNHIGGTLPQRNGQM